MSNEGPNPDPWTPRPSAPRPGWYPDPWNGQQHRYWAGAQWTAHVFPNGLMSGPSATTASPPPTVAVSTATAPPPPEWSPAPSPVDDRPGPVPLGASVPPSAARRLPFRRLVAIAALLGFVVGLLAGFVFSDRSAKSRPQAAASVAPPTVPAAPLGDPAAASLSDLIVRQADVPTTVTVVPLPGGDQLGTQATLDLCNETFPSESLRTARLQVAAVDAQGNSLLSTEAVLYTTPAATAQAFSELGATVSKCPTTPVISPVNEPPVTTHFNPAPDGAWPQTASVQRVAFDLTTTDASGQTQRSIAVYLRRGRALLGVYFAQPDGSQTAITGQSSIPGIVSLFAARLAALPASVVNS